MFDSQRAVPVVRLLAAVVVAAASAVSASCTPPGVTRDADFDEGELEAAPAAAGNTADGTAASLGEVERYTGCYTRAAAMDSALAATAHLSELPAVFELRGAEHDGLNGYRLIAVPPGRDGAPSIGGGWRIRGDSVLVVWQTQQRMYGLTLALAGDTLRGSGGPVRFEGRTRIYHPFPGVVLEPRPCVPGQLVPAGLAPPRREPPHPLTPRPQQVAASG